MNKTRNLAESEIIKKNQTNSGAEEFNEKMKNAIKNMYSRGAQWKTE